jgi:hypothetical protein
MGIIVWLKRKRLERGKENQARRLAEIRSGLQKLRRREPLMRVVIEPELARIRELKKQLNRVKSEEELRFWRSLFEMCAPAFGALLNTPQGNTKGGKRRERVTR